jgi:hypothetical protein
VVLQTKIDQQHCSGRLTKKYENYPASTVVPLKNRWDAHYTLSMLADSHIDGFTTLLVVMLGLVSRPRTLEASLSA